MTCRACGYEFDSYTHQEECHVGIAENSDVAVAIRARAERAEARVAELEALIHAYRDGNMYDRMVAAKAIVSESLRLRPADSVSVGRQAGMTESAARAVVEKTLGAQPADAPEGVCGFPDDRPVPRVSRSSLPAEPEEAGATRSNDLKVETPCNCTGRCLAGGMSGMSAGAAGGGGKAPVDRSGHDLVRGRRGRFAQPTNVLRVLSWRAKAIATVDLIRSANDDSEALRIAERCMRWANEQRVDYPRPDAVEIAAMRKVIVAARAFNSTIMTECREYNSEIYNDEHEALLEAFAVLDPLETGRASDSARNDKGPER